MWEEKGKKYVDVDNSFGANIQRQIKFIIEDNSIKSFIFDGKEIFAGHK
ncbi:hypothetical protein [Velocimicrobium porci]|nr:hypothetical protein [Velocimicrobium porci]